VNRVWRHGDDKEDLIGDRLDSGMLGSEDTVLQSVKTTSTLNVNETRITADMAADHADFGVVAQQPPPPATTEEYY
jgi:hypothetical protein